MTWLRPCDRWEINQKKKCLHCKQVFKVTHTRGQKCCSKSCAAFMREANHKKRSAYRERFLQFRKLGLQ